MATDREDIDALLIGALYGELDEAERARLDAHLASHPQDRRSLEAMRSTRGLLRDADVASAMVEPPPAVSALLLQEAARRAPVRGAERSGGLLGFLASFLRPVMAHPAMAAAAMLVVVAGAAGALYLRDGAKAVQPERASEAALAGAAPAAPVDRGLFVREGEADVARTASLGGAALDATADGFRVSLDNNQGATLGRNERAQLGPGGASGPKGSSGSTAGIGGVEQQAKDQLAAKAKADRPGYVQVDGDREVPALRDYREDSLDGAVIADGRAAGAKPAKLAQAAPPAPPPAAAPTSPAVGFSAATGAGSGAAAEEIARLATPTNTVLADKSTAMATGSAAPTALPADPKNVAPYNARSDAATIEWAKTQHARVIKLAEAGKCNDAGTLAATISKRAPDYYADQVFNDRRFRACRAYAEKARRAVEPARRRDLPNASIDEMSDPSPASAN